MKTIAKKLIIIFLFIVAANTFYGCAAAPVKFEVTSIRPEERIGILVTKGYVYVKPPSGGGFFSIIDIIMPDEMRTLRGNVNRVVNNGEKVIGSQFLQNWPIWLPSNKKIILSSNIDKKNIDYLSIARNNEVDILIHIEISGTLSNYAKKKPGVYQAYSSLDLEYYWYPEIILSGKMIRASDGRILWLKEDTNAASIKRVGTWTNELESAYDKLIDKGVSVLLAGLGVVM